MHNDKVKFPKNQFPVELVTLKEAAKCLKMQENQLRYIISRKSLTLGVYNISYKNKRINLEEFLLNFKTTNQGE